MSLNPGLKPIQQRKFLRAVKTMKRSLVPGALPQSQLPVGITNPSNLPASFPMEVEPYTSSPCKITSSSEISTSKGNTTVQYVHCVNLFSHEARKKSISNLATSTTLEELTTLILFAEGVSEDMTLELYFGEGYPLDANQLTLKGDL